MDKKASLRTEGELRGVYRAPTKLVANKAFPSLDKHAKRFIELSPFFCIGSAGADARADVSPRGGEAGFVHVLDETSVAFPDRPGNNRLDTLTNVVHCSAVGLLFFVPGIHEMLRLNGLASISTDPDLMARFTHQERPPRSVVVVAVQEVYFHCSKALRRSDLWNSDKHVGRTALPTFGEIAKDQFNSIVPAALIDYALARDAKKNLY